MGQMSSPLHRPVLLSQVTKDSQAHDLIVVDEMGLLAMAYAVCDIAFIGGSLLPFGGHNPLEPAMFGKPILLGPHMTDFLEITDLLVAEQGACKVETASQIRAQLQEILQDPGRSKQMGDACYRVFSGNIGAVDKILKKMEALHFV
jgi:3-deoxy-D-manno-octulosonic-acid transferase